MMILSVSSRLIPALFIPLLIPRILWVSLNFSSYAACPSRHIRDFVTIQSRVTGRTFHGPGPPVHRKHP